MSSDAVAGLGLTVDALITVRPETLSVAQLQESIAGVLRLIDRLGGWVNFQVRELAADCGQAGRHASHR